MSETFEQSANPDGYRSLLRSFKERGYRSASFHSFHCSGPDLIIRHDVDLSLELAARMGTVDHEEGWQATFFVLISSEFYNPASKAGRECMKSLRSMGHEIGLHFDASMYKADHDLLEEAAVRECKILEDIIGAPIRSTAFHRPAACYPRFLGMPGPFAARPHAYEPRFFSEAAYISDGGGTWPNGHPLEHPAVSQKRGIQLLTHPYLWMGSEYSSQQEKINAFLSERAKLLESEAMRNFRSYAPLRQGRLPELILPHHSIPPLSSSRCDSAPDS